MCFASTPTPPPPPPPSPPPPTATAQRVEPIRAMASVADKKRTGTRKLTANRRPTLSMGGGNGGTGVQLSS